MRPAWRLTATCVALLMALSPCQSTAVGQTAAALDEPSARSTGPTLWLSRDLRPTLDTSLREALARSTGDRISTLTEARAQLERLAAATTDSDPAELETRRALRAAHEAYVELRLDEASAACDRALESAVGSDRAPADLQLIAEILFARALIALAGQRHDDAQADLVSVLTFVPSFEPDPAVYGPPVLRALDRSRRSLARRGTRPLRVTIDRAPDDATVRLDGREVPTGSEATVDRPGRHLLVAERPGYAPRSQWIEVAAAGRARAAIVLSPAPRPLLARHALDAWATGDTLAADSPATRLLVAALEIERIVTAEPSADAEITLVAHDARSGVVTQQARAAPGAPEAEMVDALVAAFTGRPIANGDAARRSSATLTVTAPSETRVGEAIVLAATLRDPERSIVAVEARCGARALRRARRSGADTWHVSFRLQPPPATRRIACRVFAFDAHGRVVLRAPSGPERLWVRAVRIDRGSWLERWYVWAIVGVAAAGGAVAGIVAASGEAPTRQVLVVRGPE